MAVEENIFAQFGFDSKSDLLKLIESNLTTRADQDDSTCQSQLLTVFWGIIGFKMWALPFFDSWGKLPSGVLYGHTRELGNFDQCLNAFYIDEIANGTIRGQYCTVQLPIEKLWEKSKLKSFFGRNTALQRFDGPKPEFKLGICLPESCDLKTADELLRLLLKIANIIDIPYPVIDQGTCMKNRAIKFDAIDWVAIAFFSLIGLIMVMSTVYDYFIRKFEKTPLELFIAFSIITNGEKLFHMKKIKSSNVIECINGIRCFSITWIVLGHNYKMYSEINMINGVDVLEFAHEPFALVLLQGTVAVDSFFFISGFLVVWMCFKEMEKNKGRLNIPMLYFHRYVRLTPVLAVAILFILSLNRHIGYGPFYQKNQAYMYDPCSKNWWMTLLYVQNYALKQADRCFGHSWYLAVDTQLYILSPIILIPLWKWGKKVIIPIIILILLSVIYVFTIYLVNEFGLLVLDPLGSTDSMALGYFPTHARYSPWLVGCLLAFYFYKTKNKRIQISKAIVALGWLLSLTVLALVIFGPYHRSKENATPPTVLDGPFYESLSRVSWSIALAWIVFACHKGYGGPVNSILSWSIWQPFGRLAYSLYIVHYLIMYTVNGALKVDVHFSNFDAIFRFWGFFCLSISISVIVVLAFESPIAGIEKVIFSKKKKPATSSTERLDDVITKM